MKLKIVLFLSLFFSSIIHATETDPYLIYNKYYQAIGGLENLKAIKTSYTQGSIQTDHLTGHFKEWSSTPLRYRLEENYHIITHLSGDDGQHAWARDTNGKVLVIKDKESIQRRQLTKLLEEFNHLKRDSPFFSLSYEGKTSINKQTVHIIKMTNTINNDVSWLYFNSKDFLLVKEIEKQPDIEVHTSYQDYRPADGGILIAYRTHSEINPRDKHRNTVISEFKANPDIPEAYFSTPAEALSAIQFNDNQNVNSTPFQLINNLIYLPLQLQGRQAWWILDSGASLSLIDEDYATQLNLVSHPGIKGFGYGGNFDLSYVKLPSYGTQGVQIKNQTIYSLKGLADNFKSPQAMGILGYDFLSRFVVKIDYAKQLISLYNNEHFQYHGNGTRFTAPIKYNTFTLPVTLDGQYRGQWSIDLGAYDASLSYDYAAKHNLLQRTGEEIISQGLSSTITERAVKFNSLTIGPYQLDPVVINIPVSKQSSSSSHGELAGNLGNAILQHFVLYLDYKNQQVIIEIE